MMMPELVQTSAKPSIVRFRSTAFRAAPQQINREQRVIAGAALCTRGEALGHGLWLDSTFIDQITELAKAASARGLKARFAHPGLCSDGLGTYLGRWKDCQRDGDVFRGTLHLSATAHSTPKGDLAGYVLDLAEEDPTAFGTSIVFSCDIGAMERFEAKYKDAEGRFQSPDPDNTDSLPHARCAELFGCDVVDEPAANPSGFFGRGDELAAKASSVLAFLFDLPNTPAPDPEAFNGIEPGRAREFVQKFLSQHGLIVAPRPDASALGAALSAKKETLRTMPNEPKQDDVKAAEKARVKALREAYASDPAFALEAIENEWSVEQARAHFADTLEARVTELSTKVASLEGELAKAQADLAKAKAKPQAAPVAPSATVEPLSANREASVPVSFDSVLESLQEKGLSKADAIRQAARQHPALHKAWLNNS
jgi:uncharacterized small protein (DUF1192 family)